MPLIDTRLKCPNCGVPTILDTHEDIHYDEMLCDVCHDQYDDTQEEP